MFKLKEEWDTTFQYNIEREQDVNNEIFYEENY